MKKRDMSWHGALQRAFRRSFERQVRYRVFGVLSTSREWVWVAFPTVDESKHKPEKKK